MQLSASKEQQKKTAGVCVLLKRRLLFSPSSRKNILTRAKFELDKVSFSTNVCGLHKKLVIQIHGAQDQLTRTGKLSETRDECT